MMVQRPFRRLGALIACLGAFACSLAIDTSEIDAGCPAGTKLCGSSCVEIEDPAYGCTNRGCAPCERDRDSDLFGERFIPRCAGGFCVVDKCAFGFGCDELCSVRLLTSHTNCGRCNRGCEAWETCSFGDCVPWGEGGGAPSN
jgi:hypothetical protein